MTDDNSSKHRFNKPVQKRRDTATLSKAKGKTVSQQRWLMRQLNDPYVRAAKEQGYRSRAAFKLTELDDKHHLLNPGMRIVDLGCAPGGWTQVCVERLKLLHQKKGQVIGIDLQEVSPAIEGATLLQGDFLDPALQDQLTALLTGPVNGVLSDMAPASTGHEQTDHLRIMALAEIALHFALTVLSPGGFFVAKVLQGGSEKDLLNTLKLHFEKVVHAKPPSSRKDSRELFVVAKGFRLVVK
ncbi:RlmE family RNA methyltransferase [Candidatus Bodocaedibacter vickermanii]|uniref:Ribosomal RNA large subunit methyltransferase E n=1 Tax=Candidatus Bodocaedibacter vickermanii TaxID=2741701 RepID=A0A7L9RSB8_9PROT|nr:Ribosomal RNA large subunit methyltransferase E [Candidatus Paracaedibacteraceae bacterium 'Lake Konstanz']